MTIYTFLNTLKNNNIPIEPIWTDSNYLLFGVDCDAIINIGISPSDVPLYSNTEHNCSLKIDPTDKTYFRAIRPRKIILLGRRLTVDKFYFMVVHHTSYHDYITYDADGYITSLESGIPNRYIHNNMPGSLSTTYETWDTWSKVYAINGGKSLTSLSTSVWHINPYKSTEYYNIAVINSTVNLSDVFELPLEVLSTKSFSYYGDIRTYDYLPDLFSYKDNQDNLHNVVLNSVTGAPSVSKVADTTSFELFEQLDVLFTNQSYYTRTDFINDFEALQDYGNATIADYLKLAGVFKSYVNINNRYLALCRTSSPTVHVTTVNNFNTQTVRSYASVRVSNYWRNYYYNSTNLNESLLAILYLFYKHLKEPNTYVKANISYS